MVIREIPNFLTKKQCDHLISLIEKHNVRSSVAAGDKNIQEDTRTSSTSNLSHEDKIVKQIFSKISKTVGRDEKYGEHLQGQKYEPGQYFKPHWDYFHGDSYNNHCLSSGNRTHTLMIYLNDDFTGGGTDFSKIGFTTTPKRGTAIMWTNLKKDGTGDEDAFHEGMTVESGTKYIVTSWWRENEWNGVEDHRLAREWQESKNKPQTKVIGLNPQRTFSSIKDFPRFTKMGFQKDKLPPWIWEKVLTMYNAVKEDSKEEHFDAKERFITGAEKTSELMSLEKVPELRREFHELLRPAHQNWCGQRLNSTYIYGIRKYLNNADLVQHTDRIKTHHISSIVMVDYDLNGKPNWPLDIQAHDGTWHKVYLEPGDIVFYESAVCSHGRDERFQGNSFSNFYIHYQLADWTYAGN